MSVRLTIDGLKLKALRSSLGWTKRELADHASVSDKVIQRAEASYPISPETAKRIADALSVDFSQIISTQIVEEPKPVAIHTATDTVTLELTLNVPFEEFTDDDQKRLLEAIAKLLSTPADLKITRARRG